MSKKHSTYKSFLYSVEGLKTAIKREPNFRIEVLASILVLTLGYLLDVNKAEWMILVAVIFIVLILELINTSLEAIVDLISPKYHPKAKVAKDVAASAMLLAVIASVVIGLSIFVPKIFII